MSLPRVSAHLPPYNPSKSTLAFGNRALPKIVSFLQLVYSTIRLSDLVRQLMKLAILATNELQ